MGEETKHRVLAIMAHPDDIEILVGGTLLHLGSAGWELGMVTMTAGDCGSGRERTKEEISRIRHGEAEESARSMGAWYACAGMKDAEVFAHKGSIRKTVELIRSFDPEVVITHSPSDYMLDHEETARIVRGAVFAAAIPLYKTRATTPEPPMSATPALYYADPVEGVNPMGQRIYPQFYVEISSQIEEKRRLLSHHASQREWLREHHGIDEYLNRMMEWAEAYGRECGTPYAEGLRQHLGHGYPHDPRLQKALKPYVHKRDKQTETTDTL